MRQLAAIFFLISLSACSPSTEEIGIMDKQFVFALDYYKNDRLTIDDAGYALEASPVVANYWVYADGNRVFTILLEVEEPYRAWVTKGLYNGGSLRQTLSQDQMRRLLSVVKPGNDRMKTEIAPLQEWATRPDGR